MLNIPPLIQNKAIYLPSTEGISNGRRLYGDEAAGPPLQKLKTGFTLHDLQQDYSIFNYSALFLYGGLEHNPIQEWINKNNTSQVVFILSLDKAVLHFGSNPIWDRTLWLIEKDYAFSMFVHLASMATINRITKNVCRTLWQKVPIVDVIAKADNAIPPRIIIDIFTVDSNTGCIAFDKPSPLLNYMPHLKFHVPREETTKLAYGLLADHSKPYDMCQPTPREQYNEIGNSASS